AREALRCGRMPEGWKKLEAQLRPLAPALGKRNPGKVELVDLVLRRVEELHEFNPMLGHRGCRLGITYPEITEMQARALFEAAARCKKEGMEIHVEVMVPLVGTVQELVAQKEVILRVKAEVERARGVALSASVGTMIEVPRAALI